MRCENCGEEVVERGEHVEPADGEFVCLSDERARRIVHEATGDIRDESLWLIENEARWVVGRYCWMNIVERSPMVLRARIVQRLVDDYERVADDD